MDISRFIAWLLSKYAHIRTRLQLIGYDDLTISKYFRKQGAIIGDGCRIFPRALGTEPYLVRIGNRVSIAAGVTFITHDGGAALFRDEIQDLQVFGPIVIGDNCVIGLNAIIFGNVTIGPNSIVSAGSVVISDVPADTIVMGVPARPMGSTTKYKEKCIERWKLQRPPDATIEPGATWWTSKNYATNRALLRAHLTQLFADRLQSRTSDK
jgi:acetyltransferase-like isoleucine patch superfamily enzyme